ncbi:TB2/DP1, HVA22 family-domain-containing protein [Suillus paluster]|uniref:TB2/DP1, HVA22 family-domain-containing protein n=1 Tax=Suillus paluster TaxID=48578 RepID=UPI001B886808|nr:TB2/DP1, HVA22 family-domain-containing protein [Suillus paluster]KAG1737551.1 TB2/DP1, HVA22 family-domain-containing protein [Suillus paluster]
MLFYFASCVISSVVVFLYPGYASYKTLSQRPASEEDLERWLMYWSVLGCIVGVEYLAEWLVSWIPFYYLIKTLFLLYLALPQTRGSSYLYINHLQPFFHTHESQIDATLASFKSRVYTFIHDRFRTLWDAVAAAIGQQQQANFAPAGGVTDNGAPPTLADPASGPAQLVRGLWRSYGPTIVASGTALLRQSAVAAGTSADQAWNTPANTFTRHSDAGRQGPGSFMKDRKRELEAELAFINSAERPSIPTPPASGSVQPPSRASSDFELRERGSSFVGRFEEVDVPSDAEGYDIDGDSGREEGHDNNEARKPATWFGWGSAAPSKGGKSD